MGNNTKEKYEIIMRDEVTKNSFKDFYYYFNDNDINDRNNSIDKKFYNPHLNINTNYSKNNEQNSNLKLQKSINEKINFMNNIDNKFTKIKIASISSAASSGSIIKHYRHSSTNNISNSTTNTSNSQNINFLIHKRSGSTTNFQQ